MFKHRYLAIGLPGLLCCASLHGAPDLAPNQLRCEFLANPIGIDAPHPRLSWEMRAVDPNARGLVQKAYRILTASSAEVLAKNQGDLWDSGRIDSDKSCSVSYGGSNLKSLQRCFWKVCVWSDQGESWSEPAEWTTGFFQEADWKAHWIAPKQQSSISMQDTEWVWTAERESGLSYPAGARFFRWRVELPGNAKIAFAKVHMTADNSFTLYANGKLAGRGERWEALEEIDVTAMVVPGENLLAIEAVNAGKAASEAGIIGKIEIRLADGAFKTVRLDSRVRTSIEKQNGWETDQFNDESWKLARVLGKYGMAPWGKPAALSKPLPLFKREFAVTKQVRRAIACVCGLGFHELRLNGAKVGNHELEPGWTNYRKASEYTAYDVTPLLKTGANVAGVMLGNGMYNVTGGRYAKFIGSFGDPKFILHLRIEYADGTRDTIVSDDSWKSADGPVVFSCIYGGEDYDARKEIAGWDLPGAKDANWNEVAVVDGPGGKLIGQQAPPITAQEVFNAVKIVQPRPGVYVYDLGQNFSGWPELTVSGPSGAVIKLITGEALENSGLVSQRSSGAPVWFSYTTKGRGMESWHPRFSYSGFRYVQLEGGIPASESKNDPTQAVVHRLAGRFLYPETPVVGGFECSNPQVNSIHNLILAAIKSNFKSVMTDCPHREKLGWLECSHLLAGCFMYNYDCARFYEKIGADMRHAQLENGLVPDIAPEYTVFDGGFRDSPEWGSASVISPWRAYKAYGDLAILRDNYQTMKRYTAFLGSKAKNNIVSHGLGDWCDVGPAGPGVSQLTSLGLTATAVYYQDIDILRQTARLLGNEEDAKHYELLAGEVKKSFTEAFFHPDKNSYDRNSQTANAMPLFLGLADSDRRDAILQNVVRDIRASGNRITAGDVGFYYVVQAFLHGGRSDVLYDMMLQTNGPGYIYQMRQGATSLPETWDANPSCSLNHCMLGHIEEWFYSGLLGIQAETPGFDRILIKPQPVGDLTSVEGHYDSMHGRIQSAWKRDKERFLLEVTVPPNTAASIHLPAVESAKITESGKSAHDALGVKLVRRDKNEAVFSVGSGSYRFESSNIGAAIK